MKKVYEKYGWRSNCKCTYFYASQCALRWRQFSYEAVIQSMHLPRKVKVSWLVNSWGLEAEKYQTEVEKNLLFLDTEFNRDSVTIGTWISKLYNSLKNKIIENLKKECKALLKKLLGIINWIYQ